MQSVGPGLWLAPGWLLAGDSDDRLDDGDESQPARQPKECLRELHYAIGGRGCLLLRSHSLELNVEQFVDGHHQATLHLSEGAGARSARVARSELNEFLVSLGLVDVAQEAEATLPLSIFGALRLSAAARDNPVSSRAWPMASARTLSP
jgi:hypothetical protein